MRKRIVRIRLSEGRHWEKAVGVVVRNYLHRMIARSIRAVENLRDQAPKISTLASVEAIEFPTRDQVLRRWNRVKRSLKVKDPAIWTPKLIPDFQYYQDRIVSREDEKWLADVLFGLKKSAYLQAATAAAKDLGREAWVSDEVLNAIHEKTVKIVTTNITPALRDELLAKIERTIKSGMTIDETAHDLGMLNTNWRTIAKTETFDVLNKGAKDQVDREASEYGAEIEKWWQHSGNVNGRPSHIQAGEDYGENNAIPNDQPFIVGGEPLQYPHDPAGSAENNVNCGCNGVYRVK